MNVTRKLCVVFLTLVVAASTFGQSDPRLSTPILIVPATAAPVTSSYYAVIVSSPNETMHFQATTLDAAVGIVTIEGTLDSEAAVKADTAVWSPIFVFSTLNVLVYLEDPTPYIRVKVNPASGNIAVSMRGPGTRFRKVV